MKKAKVRGIAALFTALFALMLAAFLCMNVPARDVRAADETETSGTSHSVDNETELLTLFAGGTLKAGDTILLTNSIELDMREGGNVASESQAFGGHLALVVDVTIDLGDNTLTVKTGAPQSVEDQEVASCAINVGQYQKQSIPTDITVKNGKLVGESYGNFVTVQSGSSLSLENVKVSFECTAPETAAVDTPAAIGTVDKASLYLNDVTFSSLTNAVPLMAGVSDPEDGSADISSVSCGTLQDYINISSDTYRVVYSIDQDVDGSLVIPDYANFTLDLNGKTVTNTDGEHTITNYGTLTIVDNSADKTGTVDNVTHARTALTNYGTAILNGGTFTRSQEAGTYEPYSGNENSYYTIENFGILTVDGATVTTRTVDGDGKAVGGFSSLVRSVSNENATISGDPSVTIRSGRLTGGVNTVIINSGTLSIEGGELVNYTQNVVLTYGSNATITGGTLTLENPVRNDGGNCAIVYASSDKDGTEGSGTVTIDGGTFKVVGTAEKAVISGVRAVANADVTVNDVTLKTTENGFFNNDVLTEGSAQVSVSSTAGLNEPAGAVASIETDGTITYFTTLDAAFAAAQEVKGTVKLLGNVTIAEDEDWSHITGIMTLDLNGYTIYINTQPDPQHGATVIRTDAAEAQLTICDSSEEGDGTIDARGASDYTVPVGTYGGEIIIDGGTIIVDTPRESCVYSWKGGKITITGGTLINESQDEYAYGNGGAPLTVNVSNSGSYEDVTITGGTFIGRNPAQGDDNMGGYFIDENAAVGYDADGYNGTGEFTVYGSEQAAIDAGADAIYTVANSGSAEAATVVTVYTAAGIADALAGTYSVIRLGADLKLSESIVIDRALTLDLNGNTITYSGSAGTYAVEIRADGAMLTGSNGSAIVAEYGNGILVQLSISGEEGVTINGISVTANADGARGIQATGAGSVTLSGVSVTVKGAVGSLSAGVGISNGANMEITDGSIIYLTGAGNAVEVRSQEGGVSSLVVQNSTIDTAWQGIAVFGMYASGNAVPEEVDNTYTVVKVEGTTIKVAPTSSSYYAIAGNGEAHGTDITVTDSTLTSYYAAIFQPQNGILTLTGNTTLTGGAGIEVRSGTLNINDENVTIEANRSFYTVPGNYRSGTTVIGAAIVISQHSTNLPVNVNISEGTYRAVGDAASNGYAFYEVDFEETQTATDQIKTSITGGTFTGDIYSENVTRFITGGTFDTAFSEDYLGSSRYLYTSGNGYGVGTQNDANGAGVYFFVGKRGYNTLQAAIDSIDPVAEDELNDEYETDIDFRVSGSEPVKLNEGQTVTIGKGKNIRFYSRSKYVRLLGSVDVEEGGRLSVYNSSGQVGDKDNFVTITNHGTVYFSAGTRYVNVDNYGELTIASGTYQGGTITNYGEIITGSAVPRFEGTQFIANGGTAMFKRGNFYDGVTFTENGGEISLQGGSYFKDLKNADGQNIAQYVPETHGFTLSSIADMVSIIETAAATVQVEMSDGTIYLFTDFTTAINAADDGATITLLKDVSVLGNNSAYNILLEDKSLTFDLGGFTITPDSSTVKYAVFDISIGNATITFQNGKILAPTTAIWLHSGAANAGADGELILESTLTVEVTGDYSERNAVFAFAEVGNTVSLTSYATLSSGSSATIMGNGDEFGTLNIDILGGSVTSDKTVAMYLPQATCTTTIANAAITGTTGIEIRNGTLVISGDTTVTATGDFSTNATPSVGGNTVLGGAAIAVSKYDIANTSLSVTIDGGTFTAENGRAFYEGNHNPNRDDSYDGVEGTYEFANGAPVVSITGGTFNGEVEAKNITKFISGGSYTKSFNNDYLAAGYALEGSEGNYTVEVNAAAVYNDTAYETLQAAIDAAGENAATITLLQNVNEDVTIDGGQNVTLDLNGCTITNVDDHTITNNGTLVIVDNAGDGSSANMIASNFDTIYNTGTLTVGKNVYVDALSHGEAAVYNEVGGTFTLDGGRLARSKENGISSSNNGGNSFYVLLKHGTGTLNGIFQRAGK